MMNGASRPASNSDAIVAEQKVEAQSSFEAEKQVEAEKQSSAASTKSK